ncbi:MAG TPA: glucose 1-dehydrogenase [Methylomirabilota bacterium]|nr:glucose 1-dehydrogenase [Methylomirabilota bacterium]
MRLKGQVALVTGAGTGIGRGIAVAFAREGASVAVNYSKSRDRAEDAVRQIKTAAGQAMAVQGDVSKEADARRLVEAVVREWGRLDVLVNNAGWTKRTPHTDLEALTDEIWQKTLGVNLLGAWYCVKHAIPQMQRQGRGVVINVTSVAAFHGKGSSMAYAASKAALTSLTRSLARAFGPTIRVNNLAPGLVETGFVDWPPGEYEAGRREVATGDLPTVEDLAEAAVFLAADAKATTGSTLFVDGGIVPLGPRGGRPSLQPKP